MAIKSSIRGIKEEDIPLCLQRFLIHSSGNELQKAHSTKNEER